LILLQNYFFKGDLKSLIYPKNKSFLFCLKTLIFIYDLKPQHFAFLPKFILFIFRKKASIEPELVLRVVVKLRFENVAEIIKTLLGLFIIPNINNVVLIKTEILDRLGNVIFNFFLAKFLLKI